MRINTGIRMPNMIVSERFPERLIKSTKLKNKNKKIREIKYDSDKYVWYIQKAAFCWKLKNINPVKIPAIKI